MLLPVMTMVAVDSAGAQVQDNLLSDLVHLQTNSLFAVGVLKPFTDVKNAVHVANFLQPLPHNLHRARPDNLNMIMTTGGNGQPK